MNTDDNAPAAPKPEPVNLDTHMLVQAVKKHARANYERGGWDYVVEAYTDAEIADAIKGARTEAGAIKKMAAKVGIRAAYRAEVKATAF